MDNPFIWVLETIGNLLTQLCYYTSLCSLRNFLLIAGFTSLLAGLSLGLLPLTLFGGASFLLGLVGHIVHIRQ